MPLKIKTVSKIQAEPFPFEFNPATAALVIIDMQRDFVLPGGFGEMLGNDTSLLLSAVEPTERVLNKAREKKMLVIHTREGHRSDLSDCPPASPSSLNPWWTRTWSRASCLPSGLFCCSAG